jgi:hypothetical protein
MIQISRYRGLAVILVALALTLVLLDVGLSMSVGFTARFLPNRETASDDSVFRAVWGRSLPLLLPGLHPEPGTPVGLLFGQSTLGAAIEAKMLEEADGLPIRWANLHGWGGSINRTLDLVELALLSGLKPDVVLICVSPYMLIGHDAEKEHRLVADRDNRSFKRWIWTYDNRHFVNHIVRHALLTTRLNLLEVFRFGYLSLYPRDSREHAPKPRQKLEPLSPAKMARKLEEGRKLGWYDPAGYSVNSSNSRALAEIIRRWRARGAKVAVILLPERSQFRSLFPPEGVQCFDEISRAYFPDDPVPIYNLRDRIPDDMFLDPDHAGVDAMEPISKMVGACVRDLLSGHPDPQHLSIEVYKAPARP